MNPKFNRRLSMVWKQNNDAKVFVNLRYRIAASSAHLIISHTEIEKSPFLDCNYTRGFAAMRVGIPMVNHSGK